MSPTDAEKNTGGSAMSRYGLSADALGLELEYLEVDQSMAGARGVIVPYCVLTGLLFALMAPYSPLWSCLLWAGSFLIYIAARWLLNRRCASLQADERKAHLQRLHRDITTSSGVFGAIVGAAVLIAFPGSPVEIQLLWTLIMAMVVAAAPRLVTQRQFVALLIPPLIVTSGAWLVWGNWLGPPMAIVLIVMTALFLVITQVFHFGLREKFELQLRNAHLAAELERRNARLEQMAQERTQQLAAASHDLRQPVHALGLLMEIVQREPKSESLERPLSLATDCVDSLSEMLTNLMDISLMDNDRFPVVPRAVVLQATLEEALRVFAPIAARKGLVLRIVHTSLAVRTDPHVLRRMLFNLLSNAVKYSIEGTIELRSELMAGKVVLHVEDQGIGISEDRRADVFEDYVTTSDASSGHGPSVGLGLGIVRRCAAMLGIDVTMVSSIGQGSCFSIHLGMPVLPGVEDPLFEPPSDSLAAVVAVVENDLTLREALARMLSDWGCLPVAGATAEEVWSMLDQDRLTPQLILSDLHLDVHANGFEAIDILRNGTQQPRLPALILTGDVNRAHYLSAETRGIRMEHKPLQPARLRAVLGEMLSTS